MNAFLSKVQSRITATWKPVGITLGAAAIGVTAMTGAAIAQDQPGYYVGVGIGYNDVSTGDVDGGTTFATTAEFDDALPGVGTVSLGYDYEGPLRGEVEISMRDNEVDQVANINVNGDIKAQALMVNAFYDFHDILPVVTPYLGVGVGMARLNVDQVSAVNTSISDDVDRVLAGQMMAGAAVEVMKDIDLTAQYTYFLTEDGDFDNVLGQEYELEYVAHSLMLGLRFNFPEPKPAPEPVAAEPAPEPEPAPAPEPEIVRNFIVFFDWDSAVVTPEAMDVLRQAVDYADTGNVSRIVLTGHADTSGTTTYNMGLSQRRADAVSTEVSGLGYGGSITTQARGEADPLVATGDGVREPQNRRVEIVLQ